MTNTTTTPRATWETNGHYVAITLTDALLTAIESRAKADNTTPGLLCRSIVADFLGVTVDVTRSAPRKYDTEEAKKTAQTVSRLSGTALKHRLMADHMDKIGNATQAAKYRKLADEADGKITVLTARVGGSMDALEVELEELADLEAEMRSEMEDAA